MRDFFSTRDDSSHTKKVDPSKLTSLRSYLEKSRRKGRRRRKRWDGVDDRQGKWFILTGNFISQMTGDPDVAK